MPPSSASPGSPTSPPLSAAGCFEVLGIEHGADEKDVRRAYLQKARETHPDKGGSAEDFRRIVEALEFLTDPAASEDAETGQKPAPGSAPDGDRKSSGRFSLHEVSQLAEQIRRINSENARAKKQESNQRTAEIEQRRRRSQMAAENSKDEEAAARLKQALRTQRRASMPEGVTLQVVRSGSVLCERFCANVDIAGAQHSGPHRKTIDHAESDMKRLLRASKAQGDGGTLKVLGLLARDVPKQGWK